MLTLEELQNLDAEALAEGLIATFLELNLDREAVPVNGVVRRGLTSETERPAKPLLVVSVLQDDTEFPHPKIAHVTLIVSLETFTLGNKRELKFQKQHSGTAGATSSIWRGKIRDLLNDEDLWRQYFIDMKAVLGDKLPKWTPRNWNVYEGGIDEDETGRMRTLETGVKITLEQRS